MNISERVTFYRKLKGYTTNGLATKAGIPQSFLRNIELGVKNPSIETLSELCLALGISLKEFFDDEKKESLVDDALLREIFRLTPEQKTKLTEFLKLI